MIAPQLRYARLSAPLVQIAIDAISNIPGAPAKNACYVAGAPPPPGAVVPLGASGPNGANATPAQKALAGEAGATSSRGPGRRGRGGEEGEGRRMPSRCRSTRSSRRPRPISRPSTGPTETIWILIAGAVLAAGISAAFAVRRKRGVMS